MVELIRCDGCGWESENAGWFTLLRGLEFCRDCAATTDRGTIECGGHVVAMSGDSWVCSCGQTFERFRAQLDPERAVALLTRIPNPVAASARHHTGSWGWP